MLDVRDFGSRNKSLVIIRLTVDRYTSHVIFLMHFAHNHTVHITLHGSRRATQCVCSAHSFHLHVIHDERLIVRSLSVSSCLSFSCFSLLFTSSLPYPTCTLTSTCSPMPTASRELTAVPSHNRGVLPSGDLPSSHRLWAQASWRLPLLRDFCNDLPGWILWHRYGALVLVWRGTRRWDHRESAIFTTVHSGEKNQRTEDKLIAPMKKVCCQLSPFSHTQERGDPCTNLVRTKKTKIKSRLRKASSLWKTKRANSRPSQPALLPTFSRSWRNAKPFCGNAEPQR